MRKTRKFNHRFLEPLESRQMMSADLIGTAFDVTGGQPLASGTVSASFTVKNQNGFWFLDDAGAFQVSVYLSPDNVIGNGNDMLVGATSFTGLGAGQSVTGAIALSVPTTDPYLDDNDYRIGMVIDSANQVAESNETNNSNQANGLDSERVWFEANAESPVRQYGIPLGPGFTPGDTLSGAIGDERIGALDIDAFYMLGTAGQTVAFDLDGAGWNSDLRLYSGGYLVAESNGGAAPGEPIGNGEAFLRVTTYGSQYCLVVSALGNNTSGPGFLTGRRAASQGSYTINTVVLPNAPTAPDLDASNDSGLSSSDNITNASSLRFNFSGQPGKIAQLFVDGALRGSNPNGTANGDYQVTISGLSDGNHTITANLLDPTTGYASNASAPLTIRTDTTAPVAAPPDLVSGSDTGLSSSDNITNDTTPTFTGTTDSDALVQLYRSGSLIASGNSAGDGSWSLTPTISGDGTSDITIRVTDQAGNVSTTSAPLSLTLDTVGPALATPIAFQYETAPQRITMAFSDDVVDTISSADLTVLDQATSGTVGATLAYNQATRAATFTLSAPAPGALPQGNYQATLNAAGVTDVAGNGVAGTTSIDFFFMPADANHDAKVDLTDFTILAANFNQTGRTYSQGNFSYDGGGSVDLTDFTILAANFNQSLAGSEPAAASLAAPAAAESATRVFSLTVIDEAGIDAVEQLI